MLVWFKFEVRVSGVLAAGLTPTWRHFKRLADAFPDVGSPPTIAEIGDGQYAFQYDAEADGEASGVVDAGSSVPSAGERYFGLMLALDSSRIQAGIASNGKVVASTVTDKAGYSLAATGLDLVMINNTVSLLRAVRRIAAATAGSSAGAGTGTVVYNDVGDDESTSTPIVTATIGVTRDREHIDYGN